MFRLTIRTEPTCKVSLTAFPNRDTGNASVARIRLARIFGRSAFDPISGEDSFIVCRTKINAAEGQSFVDVAFWGGVVPDNVDQLKGENGCDVIKTKR